MTLKFEVMEEVIKWTGIQTWGANAKPYSFIISYGHPGSVYRCSWRNQTFKHARTHYLEGEYESLLTAIKACEEQLKKLRGLPV